MLRIRLTRRGAKKDPHYRVVVTEKTSPRDGRFVERLGYYNPAMKPVRVHLELERVDYWLDRGAQPSETVRHIIKKFRNGAFEAAAAETDASETVVAEAPEAAVEEKDSSGKAAEETAAEASDSAAGDESQAATAESPEPSDDVDKGTEVEAAADAAEPEEGEEVADSDSGTESEEAEKTGDADKVSS